MVGTLTKFSMILLASLFAVLAYTSSAYAMHSAVCSSGDTFFQCQNNIENSDQANAGTPCVLSNNQLAIQDCTSTQMQQFWHLVGGSATGGTGATPPATTGGGTTPPPTTSGGSSGGPSTAPTASAAPLPAPTVVDCTGGMCAFTNPLQSASLNDLIIAVVNIFRIIAVPFIVFFIIYAGFLFVTARGNEATLNKAKMSLMYALIGAIIIIGATVIIDIVRNTVTQF